MNTKIYVGNILYEVTDQDLRDLFSQFGEVTSAEVVRYQKSKRSKGFGFVRMSTVEQAQAAVQALNDQDYRGRKLFLDFARSEDPAPDVREKQLNTARAAETPAPTFTPVQSEVYAEPAVDMPVEEVHPEMQQQHEEQPMRNFGTIFSNSPGKSEDQ
jgi:RNA recognition motif-containing protein